MMWTCSAFVLCAMGLQMRRSILGLKAYPLWRALADCVRQTEGENQ